MLDPTKPSNQPYIESEILQPLGKVTDFVGVCKQPVRLVQKDLDRVVDRRLILDELAHGEGIVHRPPQVGMVRLVGGGEQRGQSLAPGDGLLDGIEARLDEPFVQSVYRLQRLGIRERERIGSQPDHVAEFAVQPQLRDVWPPSVHVPEPPPVGELGQHGSRVLVEAVVEVVAEQVADDEHGHSNGPVVGDHGQDGFEHGFQKGRGGR